MSFSKVSNTISIIMATYNRAHLIEETLDSILKQSYTNWECLIIDDGSTDATKEILQPYLLKDSRIRYFQRSLDHKKGLPGCRNQGLELANGEYIIFFDDDDIVHPENLEICAKYLFKKDVYFCKYDKKPFREELNLDSQNLDCKFTSKYVDINDLESIIIGNLAFASCTVMWKKKCFENLRFNEVLLYAEEWECYSRILSTGISGVAIDIVLYFNRKHPDSNTGEFYNNDPIRRASKTKAIKLVLDNLKEKRLISNNLIEYFLRLGFEFSDSEVIRYALDASDFSWFKKKAYLLGYSFYPLLRPIFILKGKFNVLFS